MPKMREDEIKGILSSLLNNSVGRSDDGVSGEREENLKRYNVEDYGDEREGRSSVLTTEARDAVNWLVPSVIDVFLSTDKAVEFMPTSPYGEQESEQITDYINHCFINKNNGYEILREWIQDGLISKTGYMKCYWEENDIVKKERFTNLSEEAYAELQSSDEMEILEEEKSDKVIELPDGQEIKIPVYSVKTSRVHKENYVKFEVIAPERIFVDRMATDWDNLNFFAHFDTKTRSELIASGYDKKKVMDFPSYNFERYNEEAEERMMGSGVEYLETDSNSIDPSIEKVPVYEAYVRIDQDGDGVAELRQITFIGDDAQHIIHNEEVDCIPFTKWCPYPDPHVWFGKSVVDMVKDLQRISTTALRSMLDNMYFTNDPRWIINGDNDKIAIQDTMRSVPGGLIRAKPNTVITPQATPQLPQSVYEIYNSVIPEAIKKRTGSGIMDQGLMPDAINKTATEVLKLSQAGLQRQKMIAREVANGLKRGFEIAYDLTRKNHDHVDMVKLRGEWKEIDPTNWSDMKVTVNVGLGTGDKEKQLQDLNGILSLQKEALSIGMSTPKELMTTLSKMLSLMGYDNPSMFFTEDVPAPQKPDPDPKVQLEMQKMQLEQQKHQDNTQIRMRELDIQEMEATAGVQLKQQDNQIKEIKVQSDGVLGQEKNQIDSQDNLATQEIEASKVQLDEQELAKEAQLSEEQFALTGKMDTDLGA